MANLNSKIRGAAKKIGLDVKRTRTFPIDFNQEEIEIINKCKPYTMTNNELMYALIHAVQYVVKAKIPGSIVECGVWKGGSIMVAIKALQAQGDLERELYLFDTFEGMTKPSDVDVTHDNVKALKKFEKTMFNDNSSSWVRADLDEVKEAVFSTGYNKNKIHFIIGKVEETLPDHAPKTISILRLDTDWYESTKHELIHLFPLLSKGGVLVIDDYGHHQGQKKAVDEYFDQNQIPILLNRADYSGRIGIKI